METHNCFNLINNDTYFKGVGSCSELNLTSIKVYCQGNFLLKIGLKLVSTSFIKCLLFHQMIALQKLWKMLFMSLKSSFRSWDIQFFVFLAFLIFLLVGHCFRGWWKINLKVHDVISYLNKSSIIHFVWYLEKEKRYDIETLSIHGASDKERFYRETMQKMCCKS